MKITQFTAQHFRTHNSIQINPTDQTVIRGRNGEGKSSLAEIVAWCLYETDITGVSKQNERLMQRGKKDMATSVNFVSDSGAVYNIARLKKPQGGTMVLINGQKGSAAQIESLFGSVDEFLSMFIPGHFSALEPKKAREVIGKCLPALSKETVMEKLTPEEQEALQGLPMLGGLDSAELLLGQTRRHIRDNQDELKRQEGELRHITETLAKEQPVKPEPRITPERRVQVESDKALVTKTEQETAQKQNQIAQLTAQKKSLRLSYNTLQASIQTVDATCHTCGQSLPAEKANAIRAKVDAHNAQIKARMQALIDEGNLVKAQFDKWLAVPDVAAVDPVIKARIGQFDLDQEADRLAQASDLAERQMQERAQTSLDRVQADIGKVSTDMERLEQRVKALQAYKFEYVRLQHAQLNAHFTHVKIQLADANKETGEIRSVFHVEWKGAPYRTLSNSERVRCDAEIGRVLAKARGETMPVFVDNAESVQHLFDEVFDGQVLAAYVGLGPLRISKPILFKSLRLRRIKIQTVPVPLRKGA
ncbi:MAG: AAA family ATPase [Bacilli bacterium]